MGLVNEEMIDPEFVKDETVILFLLRQQVVQAGLTRGRLLFDRLAAIAGRPGGFGIRARGEAVALLLVVFGDLLAQEPFLIGV